MRGDSWRVSEALGQDGTVAHACCDGPGRGMAAPVRHDLPHGKQPMGARRRPRFGTLGLRPATCGGTVKQIQGAGPCGRGRRNPMRGARRTGSRSRRHGGGSRRPWACGRGRGNPQVGTEPCAFLLDGDDANGRHGGGVCAGALRAVHPMPATPQSGDGCTARSALNGPGRSLRGKWRGVQWRLKRACSVRCVACTINLSVVSDGTFRGARVAQR